MMPELPKVTGDSLLQLLGLPLEVEPVQRALDELAHGVRPELDPAETYEFFDWVPVREIGLEFGFVDRAYLTAADVELRLSSPLTLFQVYFYGETKRTHAFPHPLPLSLTFDDDRAGVRAKLQRFEATRRSYIRDCWALPEFEVTVAYRSDAGRLESVYCHLPMADWPPSDEPIPFRTIEDVTTLFGINWSDAELRGRLAPLRLEEKTGEIRTHHEADFRQRYGFELMFTEGSRLKASETSFSNALVFGGVTFYASRELDSRQWSGPLPHGISFDDSQETLLQKVGEKPADHRDEALSGFALWHFNDFSLRAMYSNVENRILRVTIMAPGYHAPDAE